jgi:hypothetical protein
MKNLTISLLIICFGFFSCSNPSSQKNTVANNIPDTAGYFAARNMKGLATFKIGESTYSDVLKIIQEEIRQDSKRFNKTTNYKELPNYQGYDPKYPDFKFDKNGKIIGTFYREDFGYNYKEVIYDTLKSYLERDLLEEKIFGCPMERALTMHQYYIGDIEIMSLKLTFYNDTLFQISCFQNSSIESGFRAKYGDGKLIDNTEWQTPSGKTNIRPENPEVLKKSKLMKINTKIIWENKQVKAISSTYIESNYDGDSYKGAGFSNSYFKMDSKNKRILKEIQECESIASKTRSRLEELKKKTDLNRL